MIPTTIHYCWFGGAPMPRAGVQCIESWRRYFPGWEIKRWDESNFNIDAIPYTAEAARAGKWAFVSDYARFAILHHEGGVYFDTDVEVIRPFDSIIQGGPFMGIERDGTAVSIAPGLGIGAYAGMEVTGAVVERYRRLSLYDDNGKAKGGEVVAITTDVFRTLGFRAEDRLQRVGGFTIYPNEYFNPLDDATGIVRVTPATLSIHHYAKSWCDGHSPIRTRISRMAHRVLGVETVAKIKNKFL